MIPPHAAAIWCDGTNFGLALPGPNGTSHTIRIPLGEPAKLVAILQARRRGALRIAERGAPTQWHIDSKRQQELDAIEARVAEHQQAIIDELKDLGLL